MNISIFFYLSLLYTKSAQIKHILFNLNKLLSAKFLSVITVDMYIKVTLTSKWFCRSILICRGHNSKYTVSLLCTVFRYYSILKLHRSTGAGRIVINFFYSPPG